MYIVLGDINMYGMGPIASSSAQNMSSGKAIYVAVTLLMLGVLFVVNISKCIRYWFSQNMFLPTQDGELPYFIKLLYFSLVSFYDSSEVRGPNLRGEREYCREGDW